MTSAFVRCVDCGYETLRMIYDNTMRCSKCGGRLEVIAKTLVEEKMKYKLGYRSAF